jgi:hypothetical protein
MTWHLYMISRLSWLVRQQPAEEGDAVRHNVETVTASSPAEGHLLRGCVASHVTSWRHIKLSPFFCVFLLALGICIISYLIYHLIYHLNIAKSARLCEHHLPVRRCTARGGAVLTWKNKNLRNPDESWISQVYPSTDMDVMDHYLNH